MLSIIPCLKLQGSPLFPQTRDARPAIEFEDGLTVAQEAMTEVMHQARISAPKCPAQMDV